MADKPRDTKGQFTQEWKAGETLELPRTIHYPIGWPREESTILLQRGLKLKVVKYDGKEADGRPPIDKLSKTIQEAEAQSLQAFLDEQEADDSESDDE